MYTALFIGLPLIGIFVFVAVIRGMASREVPSPPIVQMLAVFAAYGAVILFGISAVYDAWSAMHPLAAIVLLFIGTPWLLVQGFLLLRRGAPSEYHRFVMALSLGFPVALVALFALASIVAR